MNKQTTLVFLGMLMIALTMLVLFQMDMLPGLNRNGPPSQQSVPILDRAESASSVTDTINREPLEVLPDLGETQPAAPGELPETAPGLPPNAPETENDVQPDTPADSGVAETDLSQQQPPTTPQPEETQVAAVEPTPSATTPAPPASSGPNQVTALQLTPTANGATIDITSLAAFERYKFFTLKGPGRLVVDLYGEFDPPGEFDPVPSNSVITSVRSGMHEDKLRIVFDLATEGDYVVDVVKLTDEQLEVKVASP